MHNKTIPFSQRRVDWIFVSFFLINLFFITYIVDIEQLIIPDPTHFQQPLWPPAPMVKMIHAYCASLDPLLLARPQWWKMTIWIDVLFYGPFYALAIYAFIIYVPLTLVLALVAAVETAAIPDANNMHASAFSINARRSSTSLVVGL